MAPPPPIELVITVLGSPAVGKSALTIRYLRNKFDTDYDPTINKTYVYDHIHLGVRYHLTIYDTAGCEPQSPTIPDQYIKQSHGYILVYSIADLQSFETIKEVYTTLLNDTMRSTVPLVLVGNKCDLDGERTISVEQGQQVAREWQASFFETSALTGNNVSDIFAACISAVERSQNVPERSSTASNSSNQQSVGQQQRGTTNNNSRPQQQPNSTRKSSLSQTTNNKINPHQQQQQQAKEKCTIS